MFKFVVLFALAAIVAAKPKPGGAVLHAGITAVSAPVVAYSAPAVAIPAAVSHQSRVDVISKPVVTTYAAHAPIITAHAPVVAAAPVVSAYAAPAIAYEGFGHGIGYGHLGYAGYGHGW